MNLVFTVMSELVVEPIPGTDKTKLVESTFALGPVPDELDMNRYFDQNNSLTKEGMQVCSETLIQSMVSCIHGTHELGYRDKAEHLQHIIARLQEGVENAYEMTQAKREMRS